MTSSETVPVDPHPTGIGRLPAFTFYNYFRSSAAYRVRIALNLKGIVPARTVDLDIRVGEQKAEEFSEAIPHGLVPAFAWEGGSLTQSLAMIEWLDALTLDRPRLIPADPEQASHAREMALAIACDIHPLNNLRVLTYLGEELEVPEASRLRWYRHWIAEGFTAVERILQRRRGAAAFALGAQPTLADICIVPQVFNARRFDADLTSFPLILEVAERCEALDAFARARPQAS